MAFNLPRPPKYKLTAEQKAFVKEVAKQLGETEDVPLRQIKSLVGMMGEEFIRQTVERSLQVETDGGMMVENGERRRTIGGIFFYFCREKMTQEQRDMVFFNWRTALRLRNAYESQYIPFVWEERVEVLEPLLASKGEVSDVKVILSGQPGATERRQHLVITTLIENRDELPSMPVGIPPVPTDPMTYVVYASARQWERIADVVGDPEDPMVVEGYIAYDPEINGMAVYATYVTTKASDQREKKQAKVVAQQGKQNGNNQPKPKKEAGGKAADAGKSQKKPVTQAAPLPEFNIPANVPPAVAQKLVELYTAAATFRQKIASLEAKPGSAGLEMTLKLLRNTEKQIESLERQYAGND